MHSKDLGPTRPASSAAAAAAVVLATTWDLSVGVRSAIGAWCLRESCTGELEQPVSVFVEAVGVVDQVRGEFDFEDRAGCA
jgi:hypothetical protein